MELRTGEEIRGIIPDFQHEEFYTGVITIADGKITGIRKLGKTNEKLPFILPGFVDSHVHIESSLMVPSEFARLAVVHGTVATVSDPHEIANVCGITGVYYMIGNGLQVPFKFNFGAPSCVPATAFETAGASLGVTEITELLENPGIKYLSEMMNFPGVLQGDPIVLEKIRIAKELNKPIDGHAPGLRGEEARKYIEAGISTDHECFTREEALDKLSSGMKIIIREGSAAKNFDALIDFLKDYPDQIMFCSDDKHPDSLLDGHINQLCARSVARGIDIFKILKAACLNPVRHYNLSVGMLRPGDPADFILVDDLIYFNVSQTYIDGALVMDQGKTRIQSVPVEPINNFNISPIGIQDLRFLYQENLPDTFPLIEALDGQLITLKSEISHQALLRHDGTLSGLPSEDILKIVVVNRYQKAPVAKAFIRNFGLKSGAIASSVAHDSHNIVAVGVDDESLLEAINLIIKTNGGLSFCECAPDRISEVLPLPIAGLMSDQDGYMLADQYRRLDRLVKEKGCQLSAPYMTLSFMALLVIPHIKLSDRGLFDADHFRFIYGHQ